MNKRDKLILSGVVVLVAGIALAPLFSQGAETGETVRAEMKKPTRDDQVRKFGSLLNPEDPPEELQKTKKYLENRWKDMKDKGEVVPTVNVEGEKFFFGTQLIVGRTGKGDTIYAQPVMRVHRFKGPVIKAKDRMAQMGGSLQMADMRGPDPSRFKYGKLDISDLPGGYGDRTGSAGSK